MMQTMPFIRDIGFQHSLLTIVMKFAKKWERVIVRRTIGFVELLVFVAS